MKGDAIAAMTTREDQTAVKLAEAEAQLRAAETELAEVERWHSEAAARVVELEAQQRESLEAAPPKEVLALAEKRGPVADALRHATEAEQVLSRRAQTKRAAVKAASERLKAARFEALSRTLDGMTAAILSGPLPPLIEAMRELFKAWEAAVDETGLHPPVGFGTRLLEQLEHQRDTITSEMKARRPDLVP